MKFMRSNHPNFPLSNSGRRIITRMIVSVLAITVLSVGPVSAQTNTVSGAVLYVTDGDTFSLRGVDRPIRVWGLDAPERDERGASAATSTLRRLVAGQSLTCRVRDIDRYGRIVGQCFLADGRDVAAQMIAAGVAREYCYFSGGYYGTCRGN
ncbi:thermonuclease family protein [Sagittula salina]|uniref:Thermonuclease family protein n=1 Tax=Sagittula salina TaxID=2820268 RepID=A0A940S3F5_9RHOB|nr:thermonuclease family protein [Sagittula salina]MBP0485031.1 thermonuclease family protein [Sagittula salina]